MCMQATFIFFYSLFHRAGIPLEITTHPEDQIAVNGVTVIFTCSATGDSPISYIIQFLQLILLHTYLLPRMILLDPIIVMLLQVVLKLHQIQLLCLVWMCLYVFISVYTL